MACRLSSLIRLVLCTPLALGACGGGSAKQDPATPAEIRLADRAEALNKTIYEGAVIGASTGFGIGVGAGRLGGGTGRTGGRTGLTIGLPLGAGAGSYVAAIQEEYDDEEERLERIASDLDRTNAEAEQALQAMRQVLEEQRAQIAAIRSAIAANQAAEGALNEELDDLRDNIKQIERAIDGAETRRSDFGDARDLASPANASAEIDPRIEALSRRITAMREIATALAEEA